MEPLGISASPPSYGSGLAALAPINPLTSAPNLTTVAGGLGTSAARDPAEAFEALLLTQLLKGMRRTVPESAERSTARDLYHELHDEMLATHLARNGGIGIAAIIRAYLERTPGAHGRAGK